MQLFLANRNIFSSAGTCILSLPQNTVVIKILHEELHSNCYIKAANTTQQNRENEDPDRIIECHFKTRGYLAYWQGCKVLLC
jgi:hypothetical protein